MRFVAVTTLLVLASAALPVAPALNECQAPCQTVTTVNAPPASGAKTYYVYPQAALCNPPAQGSCAGQPNALLFSVVYQETNGFPGLQRYPGFYNNQYLPADQDVLL